ncbi:hypothetical protein [Stutzerimonas stutzeri]|jgi:hypothetical protein|uniref:Uncharacterized protein n=1 Tax=Stutzerimonas stutzeri RCH2 TaxID=644801 RepID=L0GKK9_STUST|nr:hypothetical protein [Stutzerimonas stutzeri]AGA86327.1 hypothetical protein Psest_1780 [Stutzerimonas stutzeri RCH2]
MKIEKATLGSLFSFLLMRIRSATGERWRNSVAPAIGRALAKAAQRMILSGSAVSFGLSH